MLAGYRAHYPVESFNVVAVEQVFKCPINGSGHVYTGKFDGVVRDKGTGRLLLLEHKSEKRGSDKNSPEAWAARTQVSLYMWAAQQLYHEPFDSIILDVLTRQSDKGEKPVTFRRDILQRTPEQQLSAIDDILYIAERIERMEQEFLGASSGQWPRNTDQCYNGKWACDYADLHIGGYSPELVQIKYAPAKEYLTL